ncbi:vWA domain-containing protein [Micromonospora matsumotoense]|uniref:vWA domain-containing protein n=1 Tax=Micromonospora matsumotoense TaxID=121616 RepID=UPI003D94D57C
MRFTSTPAVADGRAVPGRAVLDDVAVPTRPPWWRRLIRPLLTTLLVLALLAFCAVRIHDWLGPPASLDQAVLEGARKVAGPVCIDEIQDVSGSMTQYTALREQAVDQLFQFAQRELEASDQLAEAVFSGTTGVTMPPTSLHALPARRPAPAPGDGTLMAPAIRALTAADRQADRTCAARALVAITDGEVHDDPAELRNALVDGAYTRMYLVVPGLAGGRPGAFTGDVLDGVVVRRFTDARRLGVIFGQVFAELLGVELRHRKIETDRP